MKSKTFSLKKSTPTTDRKNKTFDFVGLYKSAAETNVTLLSKPKTVENLDKENNCSTPASSTAKKREGSPRKKNKKAKNEVLDVSRINNGGQGVNAETANSSSVSDTRATSTPYADRKARSTEPKVKSIMKSSATSTDEAMEGDHNDTPTSKPKKRNKSVSFMLDDTEEIATKKSKSDEPITIGKKKEKIKDDKKKFKKFKKQLQSEKENKSSINMETEVSGEVSERKMKSKEKYKITVSETGDSSDVPTHAQEKKKKFKKFKKHKKVEDGSEPNENDSNNNEEGTEIKKKSKKKKRVKTFQLTETVDGEPASKVKKEVESEVIAENLENLSIGDNAHTLTSLLDEMTVVDKNKKKKNKLRRKKESPVKHGSVSSSETADLEKIEEGKEKVKWKNRKWNKDKKGEIDVDILSMSVVVENLPLNIMCSYKKLLADHFGKCGLIRRIGIAEVYPTEEPKPVFTTTIYFSSSGAAEKALEEDNTKLEGSRIRVKRPLPPTQTTVVVRSYAELAEQSLSSVFTNAGRIRNIRHLVKGKNTKATAFIEFDGPEAVERAIKMAEDARIGGKKIYVSKFELRASKRRQSKTNAPDSENEGDSENSND